LNSASPASRSEVRDSFPGLYSRLRTLLTVTDLTGDLEAVIALAGLGEKPVAPSEPLLPDVTDELAEALFLPRDWLQEAIVESLREKRQLILYGPPGTGKTYVAQAIAEHITSTGGEIELIQFHPSYSYEDFFEGFRPAPSEDGAGVTYELTPGPLRRIAKAASDDPGRPYILIIDEINRGNVPKIFGELLFLLEYRDAKIPLQYSPDSQFGLPKNLYVIGTMNTADRSIALVDAALRRRFYFVPFMPREDPISNVLAKWLDANGHDGEPAELLKAMNDRIANDEIAIGPSYFITRDGSYPKLERVWRNAIMPLLEEHYYGTTRVVTEEFGLESLRKSLAVPLAEPPVPDSREPEDLSTE
jgi:5-methylcytosine-specific restriction protein B